MAAPRDARRSLPSSRRRSRAYFCPLASLNNYDVDTIPGEGRAALRVRKIAVLTASATYIGTVVGAGFASGQEVLQFFGLLGPFGLAAIATSAFGFLFFGDIIMEAGREIRAESHLPVLRHTTGRLTPLLDAVITFFLFGALSAMIAGAGSVVYQEFGIPWVAGAGMMALLTIATVLSGLRGVVAAISAVVPFLIASVLIVSVAILYVRGPYLGSPPAGFHAAVPSWPLAGVTYISYNVVMSVPVLAALGGSLQSRREAGWSALVGTAGLGLTLLLVYLTLVSSFPDVLHYEIPLAYLASTIHRAGGPFYTVVFLAEVYTTAVANLYGFAARLARPGSRGFPLTVVVAGASGLWAASAGFTSLVRVVYPAVGWAGIVLLLALLAHFLRRTLTYRKTRRGR